MPTLEELIKLERSRKLIQGQTYQDENGNLYTVNSQGVLTPIEKQVNSTTQFPLKSQKPLIPVSPTPPLNPVYGSLWIKPTE
jgi:hypothetical protein